MRLTLIPEGSYNAQVQAAAVADELPDVLELDGPFLYRYVWQGALRPLDGLLPEALSSDLLPSLRTQGRYHGRLYSVGVFDSGLGLYARRSALEAVNARLPQGPDDAWGLDEFNALLERLAKRDPDGRVLDLKLNYAGEWYTYAFAPLLHSAGGGLLADGQAGGVLNGTASVRALRQWQGWIRAGRVDPNVDGAAFVSGRVALAFGGHWNYPAYHEALGDDLALLPLPDLGAGSRTGQGSWSWAVSRRCTRPEAAARLLAFLLRPAEILAMTGANGAVPGTRTALARSPLYRPGGALHLFAVQLTGGYAVPRPRSPAYPVITDVFQSAIDRIRAGGEVQAVLDRAAAEIDRDIADNHGYPWVLDE